MRILLALALLVPASALAQRVVILDIDGDRGGKLRTQVEAALKKADTVEVIPLKKYTDAAAKKKLKGPQAMTPAGVARVARSLKLDAAVTGDLGTKFAVRILDSTGQEVWTKELKVSKGLLSADYATKLAKAITAAAKVAPTAKGEDEEEGAEATKSESSDETPPPRRRPTEPPVVSGNDISDDERAKRRGEEASEAADAQRSPDDSRDQDLENEGKKKKFKVGPKIVSVWLAGTTTWRYYCARPGVQSCGEYDLLPDPKPQGDIVDFKPQVPYAGFNIQAELFPLAAFFDNAAQGLGVIGNFGLGFSLTNVTVQSPAGSAPSKQVVSTDRAWSAQLAYRYYFSFDTQAKYPAVGYLGVRGGVQGRVFEIDAQAQVPLPGANRTYGLIGLDVAVPVVKFFVIEASGSYFFNPHPGPDEIAGYGNPADPSGGGTGQGFTLEGGFAGDLWGPLGYRIRVRYTPYADHFYGAGNKWTYTDQGAAFESYTSIIWGITGSF